MVYAVIDTNVIVASLLTKHHDSATARVMDAVFSGKVIPLLNDEIIAEYRDVLHRKRLGLNPEKEKRMMNLILLFSYSLFFPLGQHFILDMTI